MVSQFRCAYCQKSYARESWYRKHEQTCEKRRRFEQIHNMDFRRAFRLFNHWRRRNGYYIPGRSKDITPEQFIDHWLYTSFMGLVIFASENWVITSIRYLDFLFDNRIAEAKWTHEQTLKAYREHIRRTDDLHTQIQTTYEAIRGWCDKQKVDRCEFFAKVPPGAALQMVTDNKISPWVLFGYDRSREDLLNRVSSDWLHSINEVINNTYWINKVEASDDIQRSIQSECERLFRNE